MSDDMFRSGRKSPSTAKKTRRARFKEEREDDKRLAAKERQDEHDKLSLMEKIAKLDYKLGPNVGATKERARLKATLENQALSEENKHKAAESKKNSKADKAADKVSKKFQKAITSMVKEVVKEVSEAAVQEALKKSKSEKKARKS
ncbi:MAG TPA: hypothetical protein VM577_03225 [Anaerovoracaceae bacterium]|nr:hypothetical protein [Anaerovoracaceae bacterium]